MVGLARTQQNATSVSYAWAQFFCFIQYVQVPSALLFLIYQFGFRDI